METLKVIVAIIFILFVALVCIGFGYYYFLSIKKEKKIDAAVDEIIKQTEQYKELLKDYEEIVIASRKIQDQFQEQTQLFYKYKECTNKRNEELTAKLNASRSKISVLSKNVNIPVEDLVQFLLKFKKTENTIKAQEYIKKSGYPIDTGKRCAFCNKFIPIKKTYCNKYHQDRFRENNYRPLNLNPNI